MIIFIQSLIFIRVVFPLLVWINGASADPKLPDNMVKMKAVKDRIFTGYDKTMRPIKEGSNGTQVGAGFIPRQVLELDEERGLLIMDSYIWLYWDDPRLVWNATTEYDGYLQVPADMVWLPDLSVYNSHSLQVNPMQDVLLVIHSSGSVTWVPPILTQTACPSVSESPYPNDVIMCVIKLGSWTHDGWEMNFTLHEVMYEEFYQNIHPRWELLTAEAKFERNVTFYEGFDEPYLSLDITLPLKRRSPPEIESSRKPCILIMLLTLSIFWLPPNSSKKVLLGGILFLALNVLLVYVALSTKYPLAVVYAVSFLQSTMYILVVTILLQVLVIFNLCNLSGPMRPPPAIIELINGPFGKYACIRSPVSHDNIPLDRVQLKEDSNSIDMPSPRDEWLLFSVALDRVFFVLMSIAMIAVHHL